VHSISFWFNLEAINVVFLYIDDTNPAGGSTGNTPHIVLDADGNLRYDFWGNAGYVQNNPIVSNTWTHFTGTYAGGATNPNLKIYLNGTPQSLSYNSGTSPLNAFANSYLILKPSQACSISNFKLYDVALTAEEVAMEYALGRTGKSLNLTDTSLCLGGTVPRAQLDVRGSALIAGNVGIGTTSPGAPLHINDSTDMTTASEVLRLNRGSSGDDINSASRGSIGMYLQDTANPYEVARISWQHDGADNSTEGWGKLGFWTSDTALGGPEERMTIDKSGNVGIGTASPTVSLYVQDGGTPSQSNSGLDGLFVANSGSSSSFFNIQSATGNGRVFAVTNTGVGKFDGGVSGSAADYAEMFEWIDGNPDDEDRRGLVVELVGGDKIQVATSTTSESNIIGVVSAEPCVLAGESTFHWTSKWLKDDFGSYQMEDYEAWQYSKGSGEPTVVPVEGTEPGDVPEDAVKVTAKRRIFNPDYDDTIEYVPRSQRKEWSPVGVVGRLRVKKGQPARSSWVKLKDVSEMIEEWFIR
jgi:hypothetical protein